MLGQRAGKLCSSVDAIHGHGFYVYPNSVFGRQAREKDIPFIYHAHGFLDPWILARSRWKKKLAHLLFEGENFRTANLWRALSSKEADQIRTAGIKGPVVVLPNGVHLPASPSTDDRQDEAPFPKQRPKRALFLSRLHKKKGLDLLIPAWARVPRKFRQDWELAIFGPDEGGYRSVVEALVAEAGLTKQVTLYGSVSGDDKTAAFRSADLFILPSYSEGFPMAVLEAASYGIPVVQTTECNFPELAELGGAWQCEPNVDQLAEQLVAAFSVEDKERIQRGEAGRNLVVEKYTWTEIAKQMHSACVQYLGI
jgi:glycosyltransferase involved in cell wall biosynthesis